jgi:hypothetical protein
MWQLWARIYLTHYRNQRQGAVKTVMTLGSRLQVFLRNWPTVGFRKGTVLLEAILEVSSE